MTVAGPTGRDRRSLDVKKPVRIPARCSMVQLLALTLAAFCALVAPATSQAGDPLLSGYGGPGSGQQVLLGSHLSGGGGARGSGAVGNVGGHVPLAVPAAMASGSPSGGGGGNAAARTTASAQRHGHGTGARKGAAAPRGTTTSGSSALPGAAPSRVAYPTRTDDAGGFPLSAGEVLAGLLALLAIGGMGLWLRRTVTGTGGNGAQAPS